MCSMTHREREKSAKHKAKHLTVTTLTHSSHIRLLSTDQEKHRLQQHFLISSQFRDGEWGLEYRLLLHSWFSKFSPAELESLSSHLTLHYDMASVWIICISRAVYENQSAQTILCSLSGSVRGDMCAWMCGIKLWTQAMTNQMCPYWRLPWEGEHLQRSKQIPVSLWCKICRQLGPYKVGETDRLKDSKLGLTRGLISLSTVFVVVFLW